MKIIKLITFIMGGVGVGGGSMDEDYRILPWHTFIYALYKYIVFYKSCFLQYMDMIWNKWE